jgi:hypothetical protein
MAPVGFCGLLEDRDVFSIVGRGRESLGEPRRRGR